MIWTLASLIAAMLFALGWTINAVLFEPHRVRPLYRLIYPRSSWYRRWIFNRVVLPSMRRMNESFAGMVPAAKHAAESFRRLNDAFAKLAATAGWRLR